MYSAIAPPIHESTYFLIPFGIYVFGGLYRCVWDMWMMYRATSKRVERTRVGYLTLGGFVATTLTLTDVLPRFGPPIDGCARKIRKNRIAVTGIVAAAHRASHRITGLSVVASMNVHRCQAETVNVNAA